MQADRSPGQGGDVCTSYLHTGLGSALPEAPASSCQWGLLLKGLPSSQGMWPLETPLSSLSASAKGLLKYGIQTA